MEANALLSAQAVVNTGRALPTINKAASLAKMRETAQDFEAVFLSQMLKPMFDGVKSDSMFGGGKAEDMWRTQMVDEYGKSIAKSGGIGIAGAVMREMLKLQEAK
ncbi:MAG: rod-binding protein [Magnetovibrio sp.]|nr:rod-binding protein [Magnetovibrio sp.]